MNHCVKIHAAGFLQRIIIAEFLDHGFFAFAHDQKCDNTVVLLGEKRSVTRAQTGINAGVGVFVPAGKLRG